MRLGNVAGLGELKVADFAGALARGTADVRELLSPLMPALYTFVARRTEDAEDAEDVLVETLQTARYLTPAEKSRHAPLLPWLLGLALKSLEAGAYTGVRKAEWKLLESGLKPGRIVPRVSKPPWLYESIPHLPRAQRLALGMRFGDGLPPETIAAMLEADVDAINSLVDSALVATQALCCPDDRLTRLNPAALDRYVTALLDGSTPERPREVGPGLQELLDALVTTHATVSPTSSSARRIWERFDQEHEVVISSGWMPAVPRWGVPVLLIGALLLLLGGVAWLMGKRDAGPRDVVAGGQSTASAAASRAPDRSATPEPTPEAIDTHRVPGPAVGGSTTAPAAFPGRLFIEARTPSGGRRLLMLDMERRSNAGVVEPRVVLSQPQDRLRYAISPSGGRIAYSTGTSVWLNGVDGGFQSHVYTVVPVSPRNAGEQGRGKPVDLRVGALAWHPEGRSLAIVAEPVRRDVSYPLRLQIVGLGGQLQDDIELPELPFDERGPRAGVRGPRPGQPLRATGLSWSPLGDSLIVTTTNSTVSVDLKQKTPKLQTYPSVQEVAWSPVAKPQRLVWRGQPSGDAEAMIGVANRDKPGMEWSGQGVHATWYPDGKTVVYTRREGPESNELTFRMRNLTNGEESELVGVPDVDASVQDLQFAPDGQHLVFRQGRELYLASYMNGATEKLFDAGDESVRTSVVSLRWEQAITGYRRRPPNLSGTPGSSEGGAVLYAAQGLATPFDVDERLIALDVRSGNRTELARGKRIEYAVAPFGASIAVTDGARLSLVDLKTGERRRLPGSGMGGTLSSPVWSPSGASLVYISHKRSIRGSGLIETDTIWEMRRADPSRSRILWVTSGDDDPPVSVSYSPSGRWLLVGTRRSSWFLLRPSGGPARALPSAVWYSWPPEGTVDTLLRISKVRRERRGDVAQRVDVAGPEGNTLVELPRWAVDARWRDASSIVLLNDRREAVVYDLLGKGTTRLGALPEWDEGLGLPNWDPWPDWGTVLSGVSPRGNWVLGSSGRTLWALPVSTSARSGAAASPPRWVSSEDYGIQRPTWIPHVVLPVPPRDAAPRQTGESTKGAPTLLFTDAHLGPRSPRSGSDTLWRYSPETGYTQRLAEVAGYNYNHRTGELAYIDPDGLWLLDRRGRQGRRVVKAEDGVTDLRTRPASPRRSPDGALLVFTVLPGDVTYYSFADLPTGVNVFDPHTGAQRQTLASMQDAVIIRGAEWSQDGTSMLTYSWKRATEHRLDRKQLREIGFGGHGEAALSPVPGDGGVLYLDHAPSTSTGTLLLRGRNGGEVVISKRARGYLWSPDGSSVYFFEHNSLLQASRDGKARRLVKYGLPGTDGASSLVWTPDGELSYASGRDVWTVNVETGEVRRALHWRNPVRSIEWVRAAYPRSRPPAVSQCHRDCKV